MEGYRQMCLASCDHENGPLSREDQMTCRVFLAVYFSGLEKYRNLIITRWYLWPGSVM